MDVSPPVSKSVICDTVRIFLSSDGETSTEVLILKRPKLRNVQVANWLSSGTSCYRHNINKMKLCRPQTYSFGQCIAVLNPIYFLTIMKQLHTSADQSRGTLTSMMSELFLFSCGSQCSVYLRSIRPMSELAYWNSLSAWLKIMSAISQSHNTLSSYAFFIKPNFRLVNVTCRRQTGNLYKKLSYCYETARVTIRSVIAIDQSRQNLQFTRRNSRNRKLSCRKDVARCSVSFKILLSLKVTQCHSNLHR